jgi:hypothetical protein
LSLTSPPIPQEKTKIYLNHLFKIDFILLLGVVENAYNLNSTWEAVQEDASSKQDPVSIKKKNFIF